MKTIDNKSISLKPHWYDQHTNEPSTVWPKKSAKCWLTLWANWKFIFHLAHLNVAFFNQFTMRNILVMRNYINISTMGSLLKKNRPKWTGYHANLLITPSELFPYDPMNIFYCLSKKSWPKLCSNFTYSRISVSFTRISLNLCHTKHNISKPGFS